MYRNPWISLLCGLALTLFHGAAAGATDFEKAVQRADAASTSSVTTPAIHDGVPAWLVGTWALVRCDSVYPDGRLAEPYGPSPEGLWIIDSQGRYVMQIVRAERGRLATNDTSKSMSAEYQVASMEASSNYGWLRADGMQLHVHIAHASSLHGDDRDTYATYQLQGDQLTYAVDHGAPTEAHGVLVWRRLAN
nr:lipocalin-like domain-containing protein [Dyella sp. ASV24]